MKALFIGGTGTISSAVSRLLDEKGWELYLINRGTRNNALPDSVKVIRADINDEESVARLIDKMEFDVVADFIGFVPEHLERDYRLFKGKTRQFIFISSASAYQKPLSHYGITEGTPLSNPYWEYSRNKISCEEYLMRMYREEGFPVTIVRPSHTYGERSIPLGVHGGKGSWQVALRMLQGKPVIIHGDGTSLWTMTHNSDFAKGFVGLMGNIHAIGESVHITSDETLTWNQIYQCIADALGVRLNAVHVSSRFLALCSKDDYMGSLIGDKANSVVFDNTKLKRLVPEFTATIRFDHGIRQTVNYILEHPECQIEDIEFDQWCDKVVNALEAALKSINN
ncbi:nucleoside-diphosphate-sugar epimerase [Anaerobacterium chartisolvens]|uniref:Nucleoside-diphosphate-sugar epimerase n=1 Tax=Anaerobacterium chartisolvens TaxID=1297424 RepID=A0A369B4Z7_9FIRM|nr:SDR family oxidoreductase [Anaerobacterium chartisolvens]RCX16602.1 nucleoside-diphosphate-sugar epimerase [Anaerobacterium chartisolvens]